MSPPPAEDRTARSDRGENEPHADNVGVRLQKLLASAGVGSRRACDELIAAGRVQVNGRRATLGERVDPDRDLIRVDGEPVIVASGLVHLAVHKPRGVLSAMSDARGRACIGDLVRDRGRGLHHVGRLDADSEGLLLVVNDGPLSHRLMHPSYQVPKVYLVEVAGVVPRSVGRALRAGIDLEDGPIRADRFRVLDTTGQRSSVEVVVHEGRKHVVRRMFAAVGHPVSRLVRTALGPIRLGDLPPGRVRHLTQPEVRALYRLVDL